MDAKVFSTHFSKLMCNQNKYSYLGFGIFKAVKVFTVVLWTKHRVITQKTRTDTLIMISYMVIFPTQALCLVFKDFHDKS